MQTTASSSAFHWNFWGDACLKIGNKIPTTFKETLISHLTFIATWYKSAYPEQQVCCLLNSLYLILCQITQMTADCVSSKGWSCLTFYFFQLVFLPRLESFFLSPSPAEFIIIFICRNVFGKILGEDSCWWRRIRYLKTNSSISMSSYAVHIQNNFHRKKINSLFPTQPERKSYEWFLFV